MRSANWLLFWATWCFAWMFVEVIQGDHTSAAWAFGAGLAFHGWSQQTVRLKVMKEHAKQIHVANVALRSELNRRNRS